MDGSIPSGRRWFRPDAVNVLLLVVILLLVMLAMKSLALFVEQRRVVRLEAALLALNSIKNEALLRDAAVRQALNRRVDYAPTGPQTLGDFLVAANHLSRRTTEGALMASGMPIYVDPVGLQEAGVSMTAPVAVAPASGVPLSELLGRGLRPLKLGFTAKDGHLTVTSEESMNDSIEGVLSH